MKKIVLLFIMVMVSVLVVGCTGYKELEADIITLRPYKVTEQSGLFTTKECTDDYIEYTFEYDGEIILDQTATKNILVGDKTIVILTINEKGIYRWSDLQLSLEDYIEFYGLEETDEKD